MTIVYTKQTSIPASMPLNIEKLPLEVFLLFPLSDCLEKKNLKLLIMHLASKYYVIALLAKLYSISKTAHFHRENCHHRRGTYLDKENVLRETSERGTKLRAR